MDREDWTPFLKRWSEEWITSHDGEENPLPDAEVVAEGWLGFAPAAPAEIAAAEERLGLRLPPSLREFLLVTNGWRDAGCFIYRLAGAAEIGFMRDLDSTWIDAYGRPFGDQRYEDTDGPLLNRAVQISLAGDASVLFLDPENVDEHGEWAAYELASWSGRGPRHAGSFYDLMYGLYASFHSLCQPDGETRRTWDARVEEARQAALAGEVDAPLEVFTEAGRFGRDRATLLSIQMRAFLKEDGRWFHHLLGSSGEPAWIVEDPIFEAELLPLLFAEHRYPRFSGTSPLETLMGHRDEPGPLQLAIADYQARVREPGFRVRFGDGAFDEAVHGVLDRLAAVPTFEFLERHRRPSPGWSVGPSGEEREGAEWQAERALDAAWPELREALRLWRPVSEHHIAPIVLFADPRLAQMITPERGREILATPRGGH
ncbi:SMI1/KNR4 family protein [Actinomadura rubrisoli]|uniref:Knr4/Smi1-like domain-containing protein n=1 Tax=Actinomadura rubrisoli TaxID=2530368 RepID=A0A4R5B8W8_9ACTN|nr:SMI1/KNR4 family protein [Actinomadura rubrisoli]TDD81459.1 hypothetical protein E1298_24140 [Actinomadura rubrisoli]